SEGKIIGVSVYARDVTDEKLNKDRADRYRDGLKLLNNLASNNYLSTSSRLKKSIELACYFFGVKSGALSRVDDQMIIVEASHNESKIDIKPGTIVPLTGSFTEVLIDRKEPVIIDSVSKLDFNQSKDLAKFGLKSFIGVPVFVHGELYGSLSFGSEETKPAGFDSNDLDFLNLMASWVSSVLERDQYERQLVAEKETLRAFVSAAPAAIAMFNTDIEYIASSSKWNEDYELEKKEIIGKSHYEIFPEIGEEWMEIHQRGVNGEVISRERDLVVGSNGESRWIRWEVRPWYLGADNIGGIIMFTEEITHTVQQEEELVRAKEEAEHAAQAKETFLSTMSHEIRTPMNAIIGISNLLISDNPRPDQVDNLSLLKFSSTNLLTLINDILDFNKIEAGKMELENIDFNLKEVAKNVIETLRIRAEEKNLAVIFDYQSGIPEHFIGDPVRITQVLTNLISNAIKFTAKGYVGLEISGTKSGTGYDLIIQVTDTGIGIPEEKQQSIFDNFTQASSSVTREYGGTGFGLSICKKLLTLMNSEIQLSSALNEGSTFSFTLRLPVGKVKTLQKSFRLKTNVNQIGENSNIHLLIAEDNLANQKVLARFLDRWSFNYEFANNGSEAVDMISDKSYSMVLMDIQMPVMDGFESVRRIRALNTPFHQNVPIFALTASVLLGVQEQVMAAGMNGYLGKPFDPDELYEKILEFAVPLAGANKGEMPLIIKESITMGDQEFENQLLESIKTEVLPEIRDLLIGIEKNKTLSKAQYRKLSESALLNTFEPLSSLFSVDYEHLDLDLFYSELKIIIDYFY
ncbi:MAG: ATP-binding protein, partial [Marinoscillum sp.]